MLGITKRVFWPILAALLSGVMLAMCFPDWNLSGFVWVWMLPLLTAIWRGEKKRYGFCIGYLAGLVFWLINLKWLWTVSGLGAMVMAAFLALYFGLWGAVAVSVGNPWRKRKTKETKEGKTVILTGKQKEGIEKFRRESISIRKELRSVQLELRRDIDKLDANLKVINIGLMPAIIIVFAVALGLVRRRNSRWHQAASAG